MANKKSKKRKSRIAMRAGAVFIAVGVGATACLGHSEMHPEPKESRDPTVTISSETPYTINVSYGVATGTILSALGLEFPKKK